MSMDQNRIDALGAQIVLTAGLGPKKPKQKGERDETLEFEIALHKIIEKLCPGLDSGDILADAKTALDAPLPVQRQPLTEDQTRAAYRAASDSGQLTSYGKWQTWRDAVAWCEAAHNIGDK